MSDLAPHVITQTIEIPIVDRAGVPIRIGSVIRTEKPGSVCRGVVVEIADTAGTYRHAGAVGDIVVKFAPGSRRVTNCYSEWEHIPRAAQTVEERYESWMTQPFEWEDADADELLPGARTRDEALAIEGILALLPEDRFADGYASLPDSIEDALGIVVAMIKEASDWKDGEDPPPALLDEPGITVLAERWSRRVAVMTKEGRIDIGRFHHYPAPHAGYWATDDGRRGVHVKHWQYLPGER
jgi:hypothetical protein